tara:strand:- start:1552 stop:1974 length:423 start_codon:yes stop_codon:yes gene_type:complete
MNDSNFCDDIGQIDLNTLQQLQGWQARYKQIVVWGKLLTAKPELRRDDYRVRGCDTAAWLTHRTTEGLHEFALDADSKIIRGLAALLFIKIQHKTSAELEQLNINALLIELDLKNHLSPSRSNGFLALANRALSLALDQH